MPNLRRFKSFLLIIAFINFFTPFALASQDAVKKETSNEQTTFASPVYRDLRWQEDWSVLRDATPEQLNSDFWNRIKYIPLNQEQDIWLSLGGELRDRFEWWNHFNFVGSNNDEFNLYRVLAHADLHVGEHLRFYVEGKSAFSSSRSLPGGRRISDVDSLAVQQAFVDIKLPVPFHPDWTLTIRPGRQGLEFGSGRLVAYLPWDNTIRAWDGVTAILNTQQWQFTAFATQFVQVRKYDYNRSAKGQEFAGVYAEGNLPDTDIGVDAYWLYNDTDQITFNGITDGEHRHTFGSRLYGKIPNIPSNYDAEIAYQTGRFNDRNISAYMFSVLLDYQFTDKVVTDPRLFIGYDFASGGSNTNSKVRTFNQLFNQTHDYLGYTDTLARQNIIDLHGGFDFHPFRIVASLRETGLNKTKATVHYHRFWRASNDDAVYTVTGTPLRTGNGGSSNRIGNEIDLTLEHPFTRHLLGSLNYSQFDPSRFIIQSGSSKQIKFAYAMLKYTI
ncbi:MAG: alginate export family protein [Gammaproteobacteria bacterium]